MELLAVILTLFSAYYTVKVNKLCWPFGIVSTLIYIYLMANQHLYCQIIADTIIIIQCIYGWYYWKKDEDNNSKILSHNTWITHLIIICLISWILVPIIKNNTNNPQAELDVISTLLALLANWYLAKKYVNGFMTWIIADVVLIIMFLSQHMYWSAGLYVILIGFSINGLIKWTKNLKTA
jgi:nicotinamide mononucleotide transporter